MNFLEIRCLNGIWSLIEFSELVRKGIIAFLDGNYDLNIVRTNELNFNKLIKLDQNYKKDGIPFSYVSRNLYIIYGNRLMKLNFETFELEEVYRSKGTNVSVLDNNTVVNRTIEREKWKIIKDENEILNIEDEHQIYKLIKGERILFWKDSLNLLFDNNSNSISRLTLDCNIPFWTTPVSGRPKFNSNKYLIEDTVVMHLEDDYLVSINIDSGKIVWELKGCLYHYSLDHESELLYGYSRDKYEVIDPKSGNVLIAKKFEESEEKYRISPQAHMNTLSGDGIYFMSNWYGPRFGKVNIKTHEIEFVQELDVEKGVQGDIPVYHEGRLYIRDSLNTLHIFEKE